MADGEGESEEEAEDDEYDLDDVSVGDRQEASQPGVGQDQSGRENYGEGVVQV